MLFQRLIWCALAVAVLLGSAETVLQRLQTVPLILAAEVFEESKAEATPATAASPVQPETHTHAEGTAAHEHEHGGADEWSPAEGFERTAWTWVANVLHGFSMALLALAAMGYWTYRRGASSGSLKVALAVAASGWLSLHFWPSLGLHAEVPGMDAAPLHARQAWWVLAVLCSAMACASVAFGTRAWKYALAAVLLAVPFVVGAPQHSGDALAGFSGEAHAQMEAIGRQFVWATTWLSLSFWGLLGLLSAWVFARWLKPVLTNSGLVPASPKAA